NPTSIAQFAALEAYANKVEDEKIFNEMRTVFSDRLDRFYELINDIPGLSCAKPKGAFYIFPNATEAAKQTGYDSVDDWVAGLLEQEKVALVPGSAFGAPDNVRLSYATSLELLEEAAQRIRR